MKIFVETDTFLKGSKVYDGIKTNNKIQGGLPWITCPQGDTFKDKLAYCQTELSRCGSNLILDLGLNKEDIELGLSINAQKLIGPVTSVIDFLLALKCEASFITISCNNKEWHNLLREINQINHKIKVLVTDIKSLQDLEMALINKATGAIINEELYYEFCENIQ
jgi:hypothetical protein